MTYIVSKVPPEISAPNYAIILQRLVRDPSIPMERLREAEEFIERQQDKERRALFDAAFPAMAAELPASWPACFRAAAEALAVLPAAVWAAAMPALSWLRVSWHNSCGGAQPAIRRSSNRK